MLSLGAALVARAAASEKGQTFPPERLRFADRTTEFLVLRLTDPSHSCSLPARYLRPVSRHGAFLLYCSDRTGSPQGFRMNLRTGQSQQVTLAENLDGSSLALLPDDRGFCYFDGPSLRLVTLSNLREREVYRVPAGSTRGSGFSVAPDGSRALLVEVRDGMSQLRQIGLPRGGARTLRGSSVPLSNPLAAPRSDAILCREGTNSLSMIRQDGREGRTLAVAPGRTGPAFWSPDGRTVLYLNFPSESEKRSAIRECDPLANTDQLVSATSQFADFSPNSDASVFAGASASRAAPHVLILLRRTRRELTLCEHGASDPARVEPVFSPDSQQVYFQSDRHGKPAIYCVPVEKLVEPTGSE